MAYFLLIPLLIYGEFRIFLWVAGQIGFAGALALIIMSSIIGLALVRAQGIATLLKAREVAMRSQAHADSRPEMTSRTVFDAVCLAVAGVFFIVPGFLTDILALLLLVPGVRGQLYSAVTNPAAPRTTPRRADPDVIEGEYTRLDD